MEISFLACKLDHLCCFSTVSWRTVTLAEDGEVTVYGGQKSDISQHLKEGEKVELINTSYNSNIFLTNFGNVYAEGDLIGSYSAIGTGVMVQIASLTVNLPNPIFCKY